MREEDIGAIGPHIADAGANVLTVEHDKLNSALNPNETIVRIACEVGGAEHGNALVEQLISNGYRVKLN